MRIPSNVLAFAQDKIDVYKAFRDYFNHYRTINENKTGLNFDNSISFEEKEAKMHKSLLEEIKRVSGINGAVFSEMNNATLMSNPQLIWAGFAVINAMVDMILPETMIDSVGLYTDVKTGGYGDSFAFRVKPRDLFVVSTAGRGKRRSEAKKQFDGMVTITPVEHDITVEVNFYRVLVGEESLAAFVMKAAKSMETQMTLDVYDAFNTAMGNLDNTGDDALRISGFSESTAIALAQKITAWNGGNKAMFVGTQLALANILPANSNYRYDIASDFMKIGYVREFKGFDVMMLPQVADYKTPFKLALDDTKIYVLSPSSQKIIKLCLEGSTIAVNDGTYANANLSQKTTLKKMWGTGVCTNSLGGLISL